MEHLNKVELRGAVGSVSKSEVGDKILVKFTVATHYCYRDSGGSAVFETTWHNVSVWEDVCPEARLLRIGDTVGVIGRIRMRRYCDSFGVERIVPEIVAHQVKLLKMAK